MDGVSTSTYNLEPTVGPPIRFSALLHLPSRSAHNCPLIVFPHGGPHSAFVHEWSTYVGGFLRLGFAVLKVNYRGSIGQGQDSIECLPGHVGDYDVKDVHQVSESYAMFRVVILIGTER